MRRCVDEYYGMLRYGEAFLIEKFYIWERKRAWKY